MARPTPRVQLPPELCLTETDLTVGRAIGRGANAVVFRGVLYGTPVCVKVRVRSVPRAMACHRPPHAPQGYHILLNPDLYGLNELSHEDRSRVLDEILREAQLLHRLRHPHVVAFRGVCFGGPLNDPKYIVTELAEDSLKGYLTKLHRPLTLLELTRIGTNVLSGLRYLHTLGYGGLAHLDVKLDNVLVFVEGGELTMKLADVGESRLLTNTVGRGGGGGALLRCARAVHRQLRLPRGRVQLRGDDGGGGVGSRGAAGTRQVRLRGSGAAGGLRGEVPHTAVLSTGDVAGGLLHHGARDATLVCRRPRGAGGHRPAQPGAVSRPPPPRVAPCS